MQKPILQRGSVPTFVELVIFCRMARLLEPLPGLTES